MVSARTGIDGELGSMTRVVDLLAAVRPFRIVRCRAKRLTTISIQLRCRSAMPPR